MAVTLTSSWQTLGSWSDSTHRVYLQARYRSSSVSGNTCHVVYRLIVNVDTWQTATSSNNRYSLNGTGASSASSSGGTFTFSAGDNIVAEIESSTLTGGSSVSISGGLYMGYYNWGSTSISGSATIPTFDSAPNGLSLSGVGPSTHGFSGKISVTDWGTGGSTNQHKLSMSVCAGQSIDSRRYVSQAVGDSLSATITVDNTSEDGNITIQPNATYYLTMYATNGARGAGNTSFRSVATLPPQTTVSVMRAGLNSARIQYEAPADGGAYAKTLQYSLDGGKTWIDAVTIADGTEQKSTFVVNGLSRGTTYTMHSRVVTTAGITKNEPLIFTTDGDGAGVKLYAPVNGKSASCKTLYASVNGKSKLVQKLYASVNGKSKLVG